jgi:hypothetical protein
MTTRDELIEGFRMIVREGLRTTRDFGPDDWSYQVDDEDAGWTAKQIYAHLAATADVVPVLVGALSDAEEGQNTIANIDVDAYNAQSIASREGLDGPELMANFQSSHEKLIEFIQSMPEEQLEQRRVFGAQHAPVAEIIDSALVLHGLSHIYHAQSRPLN